MGRCGVLTTCSATAPRRRGFEARLGDSWSAEATLPGVLIQVAHFRRPRKNTHMSPPDETRLPLHMPIYRIASGCTLVSVLLHAGSTAPQATTALAPTALLDPLPSNFVLWTIERFIVHPSASLRNLLARSSPVTVGQASARVFAKTDPDLGAQTLKPAHLAKDFGLRRPREPNQVGQEGHF